VQAGAKQRRARRELRTRSPGSRGSCRGPRPNLAISERRSLPFLSSARCPRRRARRAKRRAALPAGELYMLFKALVPGKRPETPCVSSLWSCASPRSNIAGIREAKVKEGLLYDAKLRWYRYVSVKGHRLALSTLINKECSGSGIHPAQWWFQGMRRTNLSQGLQTHAAARPRVPKGELCSRLLTSLPRSVPVIPRWGDWCILSLR